MSKLYPRFDLSKIISTEDILLLNQYYDKQSVNPDQINRIKADIINSEHWKDYFSSPVFANKSAQEKTIQQMVQKTIKHYNLVTPSDGESTDTDSLVEQIEKMKKKFIGQKLFWQQLPKTMVGLSKRASIRPFNKALVFKLTGPPGVGKTTIANLMAGMLLKMNLLEEPEVVEARPADFPSEGLVGKAEKKLGDFLENNRGRVIFFDEAYGFSPKEASDSHRVVAKNLVDNLMKAIDTYQKTVFIFAGYEKPLEHFFKTNEGLNRRIDYAFNLFPYSDEELAEILSLKLSDLLSQHKLDLDERSTIPRLTDLFKGVPGGVKHNSNAGLINQILARLEDSVIFSGQKVVGEFDLRKAISEVIGQECFRSEEDIQLLDRFGSDLIGNQKLIEDLKQFLKAQVVYQLQIEDEFISNPWEYQVLVFTGNPGVGKTTIARKLAKSLCSLGMILKNQVVEKTGYEFSQPKDLESLYEENRGSVIFIDEAYQMGSGVPGLAKKFSDSLIGLLNRNRDQADRTVFILAGYRKDMTRFLNQNVGLKRRIGNKIFHINNYTDDELFRILELKYEHLPSIQKDPDINLTPFKEMIRLLPESIKDRENAGLIDNVVSLATEMRLNDQFDKRKGKTNLRITARFLARAFEEALVHSEEELMI